MATGIFYDERLLLHGTGELPEQPERLVAIMDRLRGTGLLSQLTPVLGVPVEAGVIECVHPAPYLERLREACERGQTGLGDPDVVISRESCGVAVLAVGGILGMCDAVMKGAGRGGVTNGFCAIRPPGHHAEADRAMGFCLLNNVAIAARYLQSRHGLKKIAIVDFDVHHGNGTQHIFEGDDSVLFVSLHEHPDVQYPGTGYEYETGAGAGRGFTLNVPMAQGAEDADYHAAFKQRVVPALRDFSPEFLLISAGFDGHADDPIGNVNLTTACFAWMTEQLKGVAHDYCGDRVVSVLEGGYNYAALAECVEAHLATLLEPA